MITYTPVTSFSWWVKPALKTTALILFLASYIIGEAAVLRVLDRAARIIARAGVKTELIPTNE